MLQPPALGSLRLAKLSDLTRLGVIAAAGFFHSPWFAYERPHFASYPNDTLASYRSMYMKQILDPQYVVLVAVDVLNVTEASACYQSLADVYPSFESQIPADDLAAGRAIVAVAGLKLQTGSKYRGQFQPEDPDTKSPQIDLRNRDQSPIAAKLFDEAMHDREARTFDKRQVIDTMVVHPAYWRHHHGTDLALWMLRLATTESVGVGVAAAKMGKLLFEHLGFEEASVVEVPGYELHREPIYGWLGLYNRSMGKGEQDAEL